MPTNTSGSCVAAAETQASHLRRINDLVPRVQGEFLEMPGLCLTIEQAQRLWGLDRADCEIVMTALIDMGFLFRTRVGGYARPSAS
jgi:hypothetical protein